jgi:hypothetical protein
LFWPPLTELVVAAASLDSPPLTELVVPAAVLDWPRATALANS